MKQMNWYRTVFVFLIAFAAIFLAACQAETMDSTRAADIHAARWQAMADYYAQNGMLTPDNEVARRIGQQSLFSAQNQIDFAADLSTARWQSMVNYYRGQATDNEVVRRLGQTTLFSAQVHGTFDYEAAADNQAARWVAMGRYYEKMGLLNSPAIATTAK